MKQFKLLFFTFIGVLLFTNCQSQVGPVITFDTNEHLCSYHHFEGVDLYATFDLDNNEIKIYNTNHQVEKSLIYNAGTHYNVIHVYGLSRDVFNSDSNLEFIIYSVGRDGTIETVMINDQNTVIQEFKGSATFRTIGNKNYIAETFADTNYDQSTQQASFSQTSQLYPIEGKFRKLIY